MYDQIEKDRVSVHLFVYIWAVSCGLQIVMIYYRCAMSIHVYVLTKHQLAGASIHFSDWGGGKSKENFKNVGALHAQSHNI